VIPTRSADPQPETGSNSRFTILCIEDDPAISRLYELRLQAGGAHVICAGNGAHGYSLAIESSPDLILLDNELPDVQGVDLLARLRSHPSIAEVAILMLTGLDTRAIRRRLLIHGVIDVLTKPINFEQLLCQIARMRSMSGSIAAPNPVS
jgi:DNA-binding response OmpR family regulator